MHASALAQKGPFPAGHPSLVRQGLGRRSGWRGAGTAQTLASGAAGLIFREVPGGHRRGSEQSGAGRRALGRWGHSASRLPSVRCLWCRQ